MLDEHERRSRRLALPDWRGIVALVVASVLLSACGPSPTPAERSESPAPAAVPGSPLAKAAQASTPPPPLGAFRLMPVGPYSRGARIELVRRARQPLDVQYYLTQNDR